MKTTKKQKKSNLKVSLLLLLLAAVLLISSTYAWFVTNNTAKVSTINVKVETVEGLQISTDAAAWKAEIPLKRSVLLITRVVWSQKDFEFGLTLKDVFS